MSCSSKYEKLVEYLKTHYTYQLKLNNFDVGNNENSEASIKRNVYGQIMEFVENLETQEELNDWLPFTDDPVWNVLYTGVGKVNATYKLTEHFCSFHRVLYEFLSCASFC